MCKSAVPSNASVEQSGNLIILNYGNRVEVADLSKTLEMVVWIQLIFSQKIIMRHKQIFLMRILTLYLIPGDSTVYKRSSQLSLSHSCNSCSDRKTSGSIFSKDKVSIF